MSRPQPLPPLVIDARPRGDRGLLAGAIVLGRPVLGHLVESLRRVGPGPIAVHARASDHEELAVLLAEEGTNGVCLAVGPPPEGAVILRADRIYDPSKLSRAARRGRDPESAAIWRLDRPDALESADAELTRRRDYQPLGRFWALTPARTLARKLAPTAVRPNLVTLASAGSVLGASAVVAWAGAGWAAAISAATLLAIGLVLDTADGHLARLQGTASEFGRWLDGFLDEVGDMALHAAAAWAAFARSGSPGWLVAGMAYGMSKYLFFAGNAAAEGPATAMSVAVDRPRKAPAIVAAIRLAGHADVRWHLWILLAALGRLDVGLVLYAAYFAARTVAGAVGKAVRLGRA